MLFADAYLTISGRSAGGFRDRGSKFLSFAFNVGSEEEIRKRLIELRKEHASASHHCYAWRLGPDKLRYRVNDDGEPSGTAGRPIYSQIQSKDLTDILIVVVRYFGGSLLGVPGLINAYRTSAADCLFNATIVEREIGYEYSLAFLPEHTSGVMKLLHQNLATVVSHDYTDQCILHCVVAKARSVNFEEQLKQHYQVNYKFLGIQNRITDEKTK